MVYNDVQFVYNVVNVGLNVLVLLGTMYLLNRYGECDFQGVVYNGPFAVGCRSFYVTKSGCPVTVYYPVDKALYEESGAPKKKWLDHNESDRWIK